MSSDAKPNVVEIHPVGPTERTSRSVLRRDGSRVELRITPIAECATCSKSIPALACACCGDGFLARLAVAHGHGGALLCMACLAARSRPDVLRLVELMETGAMN